MAINYPQRYDDDFLNTIKTVIDHVNIHGKTIQDLVADGQLTEEQYANLITTINGMIKSGEVDKSDLTPELRSEVDTLQNKIDKGEVSVYDINKNKGRFDQTYLTQDLIDAITGVPGANILSEVAPKSVTRNKISEQSVGPEQTDFVVLSTNKFNKEDITEGYYIGESGEEVSSGAYSYTHKIYTNPNQEIYAIGFIGVSFYGDDGAFISRILLETGGEQFTVPADVYEMIFNLRNSEVIDRQVNFSTTPLQYEPFYRKFKDVELDDNSISIQKTDFFEVTEEESFLNLFDKRQSTDGGYYDSTTLNWVNNSPYSQSEFIPAEKGDVIRIKYADGLGVMVVFKNAQGEIFSGLQTSKVSVRFVVPADAVSFSFNYRKIHENIIMVVKNMELPDSYVPYGNVAINDLRVKQDFLEYIKGKIDIEGSERRFYNASFLGDSITWGYSPYDGSKLPTIWPDLVAEELDIPKVNNYGISGSTLASPADDSRQPMVDRYINMDENSELICVFGGTNDWNNNIPIGTIEDTDKYTFYGALKLLAEGLYNDYPDATVVFFTPLHRSDGTNHATKGDIIEFRNAIIEVGERYAIPVLDLYGTSGLYPENESNKNNFVPDGRHPNIAGHKKLAKRIVGFLKTI